MSFELKMVDTKLRGIQCEVDSIGNKLFAQNRKLGEDLKLYAFEIGMVRATLKAEAQNTSPNRPQGKIKTSPGAGYPTLPGKKKELRR